MTASGVELRPTGKSLMGCCPLHGDHTASLSVGGLPDRFHRFGCGASGDVIEYVARLRNLTSRDAVAYLELETPHRHERAMGGLLGGRSSAEPGGRSS